jgi:hypothetical protein
VSSVLRCVAVALIALGAVSYVDWLLQLVLPVHADLRTSFISELSASGQPYHDVFRISDAVGGLALAAGSVLAWVVVHRWLTTWAGLAVLGACVALEAALPLGGTFTFTFAAHLAAFGTGAWWHRVSEPHGLVSVVETVAYLAVLAACTRALARTPVAARRRRLIAAVGLGSALGGLADAALTATLLIDGNTTVLGLAQRSALTLTAVWLLLAPTLLLLRTRPGEPDPLDADDLVDLASLSSAAPRPVR